MPCDHKTIVPRKHEPVVIAWECAECGMLYGCPRCGEIHATASEQAACSLREDQDAPDYRPMRMTLPRTVGEVRAALRGFRATDLVRMDGIETITVRPLLTPEQEDAQMETDLYWAKGGYAR